MCAAYEAPHSSPLWDTFAFLPTTHLSQRSCPWPAFMPSGSVSIEVSSCLRYKTLDNKKHCFPHMGIRAHFLPWQIPEPVAWENLWFYLEFNTFMILYMGKIELLSTVCLANKYPIKNPLRSVSRVLLLLDKILNCYESVCHQIYLLYVEWKPNLKKVNTQVSSDVSSNSGFWLCLAGRTLIIFYKNGKSRPSIRIKYKNKKVS